MHQGKLEVIKQEMARVNIDILGISELKLTGMGEFNSDDCYIYYCGQESLPRNGVAIIVNRKLSPYTQVRSLGGEDPLEKEIATHSSILTWKIPWTEDLAGYI